VLVSARLNRVLAGVLAVTTVVHLGAHLASATRLAEVTQWFLMPLLAAWVATAVGAPRHRPDRLVRFTLAGLAASWLGDTAPDLAPASSSFLVMVGFFLCAQICYIAAFWPSRARSVLGPRGTDASGSRRTGTVGTVGTVAYVVVLIGLVAACAPGAGSLLVPTVVYGVCLVSMAALATGVNGRVALGGAIFLVSDSLIALHAFTSWYAVPQHGFWVMLTYVAGQALIASGVVAQVRVDADARRDPVNAPGSPVPDPSSDLV